MRARNPYEEGGGVGAGGDGDDMGREPEIGVEDGAHHFQGVGAQGEVVRDHEGGEADQAAGDGADGIAINPFEDQAQSHRAPADEEGGGIRTPS